MARRGRAPRRVDASPGSPGRVLRSAALLLAFAALLPGCLGAPDWALTGVSATALFLDDPWDPAKAEAGLREAGFQPVRAGDAVSGTKGTVSAVATSLANGTVQLALIHKTLERAGSRAEAETRAQEVQREREAETEALVAAFERGSGWTRDAPLRWDHGVLHGD